MKGSGWIWIPRLIYSKQFGKTACAKEGKQKKQ